MSLEQSGLFRGFDLREVQQSIHLVTAILVELSRGQTPYVGPAPGPLTGDQRDTVRDLVQRLYSNEQPFNTYFTAFMNDVVGLNEGRHFTWSDERIEGAIKSLDSQFGGHNDQKEREIKVSGGTPSIMDNTSFSGQQFISTSEHMQPPSTPQQSVSFDRQVPHTTSYHPHYQPQARSYAGGRMNSSNGKTRGFDQGKEYRTPYPPYDHRLISSGSAHNFGCFSQEELTHASDAPRPTSSNRSAQSPSQREAPHVPIMPDSASAPYAPIKFFEPNMPFGSPLNGTSHFNNWSTEDISRGFNVDDMKEIQAPITPEATPGEPARLLRKVTQTINFAGPLAPAPPVNTSEAQQALPAPSVSLRSPFVPTARADQHKTSSRRPANYSARPIGTLVDEEPAQKNQIKRRGELPVEPTGGVDRTPAVVGKRDPAKLVVQYETRKVVHNGGTRQLVKGAGAFYRYPHRMDWNSKEHIKKLNAWREQIHRRQFDRKRKTRHYWLESEKVVVLELLEAHLQERSLQDKHEPLWNRLANTYNTRNYKRLQRTGSRFVADGKAKGDGLMDRDRLAPWRTSNSLLGISKKWPEIKAMLMAVRRDIRDKNKQKGITANPRTANEEPYSDDEEMIDPDEYWPTTAPTVKPTKRSRKQELVEGPSLRPESDEEDVREDLGSAFGKGFGDGSSSTGYMNDGYAYDVQGISDDYGQSGFDTSGGGDLDDTVISRNNLVDESDGEAEVPEPFVDEELSKEKRT